MVAGARRPCGRLNRQLSTLSAVKLGTIAIHGAFERARIDADDVQAGCGQSPARQSSIAAGIGWDVKAVSSKHLCWRRSGRFFTVGT
ncbi:hypothetical protein [Arthrobacter sp. MYb227]|uniref:thiolase family protein n=1 Tax=Arthrobacter sp. MYb227 TaxID=1848601 RepID=UPI0021580DFC|nr:hypothetical protein [Arthrobacter sp. MYb227]